MAIYGWVLGAAAGLGLAAGVLIGAIGVGGIILVPSLIELPSIGDDDDTKVRISIASCMFSYIFVGLAGGYAYSRKKSVIWPSAMWLILGAVPGAFGGAFAVKHVKALAIKIVLYSLIMLSAIYAMYQTLKERKERRACEALREGSQGLTPAVTGTGLDESSRTHSYVEAVEATAGDKIINDGDSGRSNNGGYHDYTSYSGRRARVVVGAVTGIGSALTGSSGPGFDTPLPPLAKIGNPGRNTDSGPVILLPILISLKWDMLDALGSAQVIQLPMAVGAVVSFVTLDPGVIDFMLGSCIGSHQFPPLACTSLSSGIADKNTLIFASSNTVYAAGLVPGAFIGAAIAHRVPVATLKILPTCVGLLGVRGRAHLPLLTSFALGFLSWVAALLVVAALFLMGKLIYTEVET